MEDARWLVLISQGREKEDPDISGTIDDTVPISGNVTTNANKGGGYAGGNSQYDMGA